MDRDSLHRGLTALEMDTGEFRRLVELVMDRLVRHLDTLDVQRSALGTEEDERRARTFCDHTPPRHGTPLPELLDSLFEEAIPLSLNTAGPGYMAYVPGGGVLGAAIADLIADTVNRYVGARFAAPALVELEHNVVQWLCGMVGYTGRCSGLLTTGGSMANFTALVLARSEALGARSLDRATVFVSELTHHTVARAAWLSGVSRAHVRVIECDDDGRIRVDQLTEAIEADKRAGLTPILVSGTAGTTGTGAIDDLARLRELATRHGCWFHVDAAYGGFFILTERGRPLLQGLELADSITLDPHKGLFLPYGTGALLVRDGAALRRAHSYQASYIDSELDAPADFSQMSPELSRDFRGLRVWLPIQLHGLDAFRDVLDEKLSLAAHVADELAAIPEISFPAPPSLSIVCFRLEQSRWSADETDALNRRLLAEVNRRGIAHLSPVVLNGRYTPRVCILSFRTHREHVDALLGTIREVARDLASGG